MSSRLLGARPGRRCWVCCDSRFSRRKPPDCLPRTCSIFCSHRQRTRLRCLHILTNTCFWPSYLFSSFTVLVGVMRCLAVVWLCVSWTAGHAEPLRVVTGHVTCSSRKHLFSSLAHVVVVCLSFQCEREECPARGGPRSLAPFCAPQLPAPGPHPSLTGSGWMAGRCGAGLHPVSAQQRPVVPLLVTAQAVP